MANTQDRSNESKSTEKEVTNQNMYDPINNPRDRLFETTVEKIKKIRERNYTSQCDDSGGQ
jgi:hypothetical protein